LNIALHWNHREPFLTAWGRKIPCACDVRTLENGRRKPGEIVYTLPHGKPYMPQGFPEGLWQFGRPRVRTDCYRAPFFIPTNAARMVRVWEVRDGAYYRERAEWTLDEDYGLHASASPTTLGCIRIGEPGNIYEAEDVRWLAERIEREFGTDILYFEVN